MTRRTAYDQNLEARIADLEARVALVRATPWTPVTFLNSWTDYGGGVVMTAAYCKDNAGFVHLRGLIRRTVVGGTFSMFFQLPATYRPSKEVTYAQVGFNNFARIIVQADGNVYCGAAVSATPETFISLDGITFDTRV